jgi:formylglycine-generating enzyme required for sulfatase activity
VWTGAVSFDETWANAPVEIRLAAEDGAGTLAESTEAREVGTVDRVFPLRVAVEFGGVPVESLRLVEGNATMPYVFGGRVDAEEERAYASAGLPPYNTLSTARSWGIPYETREVKSFYLDEREVSVAQYLAFVRAESGYATGANWPTNSPPDERRRKLLDHVLSSMKPDLPVVDVTWEEASAYAHWTGKRLPSIVEWEYAVRGGTKYRPFASAVDPARAPKRSEVNFDPDGAGDGAPWPCSQGGDLTADTGLRDLAGNVAEWTATPASYLVGSAAAVSYPAHALEHREAFLDPRKDARSESMERFWVAGGSFRSARADFMTVDRRARTWHGDSVGFRCAADVEIATVAAESAEKGRPSFRGIFE